MGIGELHLAFLVRLLAEALEQAGVEVSGEYDAVDDELWVEAAHTEVE